MFFFNDTATTEIYTLSLHDALPIYASKFSTIINQVFIVSITTVLYPKLTEKFAMNDLKGFKDLFVKSVNIVMMVTIPLVFGLVVLSYPVIKVVLDRKSTRLNSSHANISYAVFCLKKKKKKITY